MFKRNISHILVIVAMLINILNYNYSSAKGSMDFALFIGAILIIIAALILIFRNESKKENKNT